MAANRSSLSVRLTGAGNLSNVSGSAGSTSIDSTGVGRRALPSNSMRPSRRRPDRITTVKSSMFASPTVTGVSDHSLLFSGSDESETVVTSISVRRLYVPGGTAGKLNRPSESLIVDSCSTPSNQSPKFPGTRLSLLPGAGWPCQVTLPLTRSVAVGCSWMSIPFRSSPDASETAVAVPAVAAAGWNVGG